MHDGSASDSLGLYLKEISRYPLLTRAEEVQLAKRIEAGDQDAKRRMVESNLRLVVTIAKTYRGRGVEMLDMIQEGTLGLMRAAERYDWRRDVKFGTYAAWWIRNAIFSAWWGERAIRIPESIAERASAVRDAESRLQNELGREPTTADVAAELDLSLEAVAEARVALQPVTSLDEKRSHSDGLELADGLADPAPAMPFDSEDEDVRREALEATLARLPERDRRVIELRFGLGDEVAHTADEVALELGVTRQRVRQIELRALLSLGKHARFAGLRQAA
jgi:RNA polymerase primary sigma factor